MIKENALDWLRMFLQQAKMLVKKMASLAGGFLSFQNLTNAGGRATAGTTYRMPS
jgi:hypothetical protein